MMPESSSRTVGRSAAASTPTTEIRRRTPSTGAPWYRTCLVGLEYGPTGANDGDRVYMSNVTGAAIIEALLKARAEYGVIFFKDQNFAYYDSRLAVKAPNLGTSDLLRECTELGRRHGLAIIAYCQVQYDTSSWQAHPEWRMQDAEGNDIPDRLCFNSEYLGYVQGLADEMMAHDIVGFHFDMLDHGFGKPYGCWCPRCQARFQATYNMAMPTTMNWDYAWECLLEFRYQSSRRFCQELERHVKARRPELSVDFNYHGYPPFSWEVGERPVQHAQAGDFVTAEGLPWIFGHYTPSLLALFMAGVRPGGTVQAVTSRHIRKYHDYTVRPVADMAWEVFTYLSHGAQCTIVDKANYDGSVDAVAYERIGAVFDQARQRKSSFGHEPLAEVGLYYSGRSRDWYGREDASRYFAAFCGAHKALVQAHVPLGVLADEDCTVERLAAYPVVYVPHATVLSNKERDCLQQYVGEGGKLLLTGLTGLATGAGELCEAWRLDALTGNRLVRVWETPEDNYICFPTLPRRNADETVLAQDVPRDWPLLTWGPLAAFEPQGARTFGTLMQAHRSAQGVHNLWEQLMSAGRAVGPAVFVNRYGKGQVIHVPCLPDAAYVGEYRAPEHRLLIRNLVRCLNPRPQVRIDAPLNVEAVVRRDADRRRWYVHLVAFWAPPPSAVGLFGEGVQAYPPLMEESFSYCCTIEVDRPIRAAVIEGDSGTVRVMRRQLKVETAAIHNVVVIDFES